MMMVMTVMMKMIKNKENIIQQKQVNFGQVIQSHSFFWQKNFGLVQTCPVAKDQQVPSGNFFVGY